MTSKWSLAQTVRADDTAAARGSFAREAADGNTGDSLR